MSYFKKFTDFCAGVGAFAAAIFFIRKYMAFKPEEPPEIPKIPQSALDAATEIIEETEATEIPEISDISDLTEAATELAEQITDEFPSKLEQFLKPSESADYSMLIPLIILLLLSALLGRVFKRLPYVCFGISILPALMIAYMYETQTLHEQIPLFIIIAVLHVAGNLVECLMRDREDGRHRASIAAKISTALGAFFCFFVMWRGAQPLPEDIKTLNHLENRIMLCMTENDVFLLTRLGWMFVILFAVSILLYNVYFIDALVSIVPAAFVIYQTGGEYLTLAPTIFCTLALICTLAHLALAVFENNLSRNEQAVRGELPK